MEDKNLKDLKEKLENNNTNIWNKYNEEEKEKIKKFSEEYKRFLKYSINEKRTTKYMKNELKENGFVDIFEKENLEIGDKIYYLNRGKSIYAVVIGENILDGMNIIGSHADSPRLDLKQMPIYEEQNMALAKTHVYGGIKKHQWTTIPLILVGDVYKTSGEKIEVNIGEDENDPVFTITELLPHLASRQMTKNAKEFIEAEQLNVLLGGLPLGKEAGAVKLNILNMLYEKYNINEKDFGSAELMVVPNFKPKDVGIDRSFVGGYGQDDKVCAFAAFKAFLNEKEQKRTKLLLISDKEEVGSLGNTGMESRTFDYFIELILDKLNINKSVALLEVLNNSKMLSADVTAAVDPTYIDVHELLNDPVVNGGVAMVKYTGGAGKSNASDANPKFIAEVRKMFEENNVNYQYAALGKQGIGGGGTIAYILANKGVEVLDCGTAILSMHSPFEVASKADIYETYKAYDVFFNK